MASPSLENDRRPVRVLITGPHLTVKQGAGVQRHVRNLLAAFASDRLVCPVPFAVTPARYFEPWLVKGLRLAWKYVMFLPAAYRADVVHINSTIDDRSVIRDAGLVLLARVLRRPVVLQFHGGYLARLNMAVRAPFSQACTSALRYAAAVLFLSPSQGEPLRAAFGLANVHYVRNCVAARTSPVDRKLAHTGFHVLYLGRLDEAKGVLEALEGYLLARQPGWELRIAGAGPAGSRVKERAGAFGDVRLMGFIDGRELEEHALLWSDVMVLPSAAEGLPYAVLEAAAAGSALVTSNVGALSDVVRDGITGYLVPPRDAEAVADALRKLCSNPSLLRSMQGNAQDLIAREYSLECMHEGFTAIWMDAVTSRGGVS